ncbi:isocitrate lyase/PEP mutase family protein [Marinimicrococcus flavescens]|uniref:Isocitrate lyase/phosphoenolpyruvate mutase family protein n=1 Tax=Marinimicrococcus flavescens TaxID=3031815 RepID=A0AAP4D5Q1_9PROT|nr:isocitrate lyase/phosphoenolpyruvate mutase family protein [Marinimicrococcus flavescens]
MASQLAKARRFGGLHDGPGAFVMPNAWDAGTARLLAGLGFEAIGTTSAGLALSLGRPDGQGAVSLDETLANARAIVEAVDVPVSADLENGFGHAPEDCARTIRLAAATGLAGGSIEDATGEQRRPVYDFQEAVERVAAAAEAARGLTAPFILTARAENFLHGRPDLDDTIRRLQAFAAAGADVLYAPGLPDLEAIRTVCAAVGKPVNVVMGLRPETFAVAELAQAGVRRISIGGAFARVAFGAFLEVARSVREEGRFERAAAAPPTAALLRSMNGGTC